MTVIHKLKKDELKTLYEQMSVMNTSYAPTTQWVMAACHWVEILKKLHTKTFEGKVKNTLTLTIPQACAFNIYMCMMLDNMGIYPQTIIRAMMMDNDKAISSLKQEVYYAT